MMSTEYSSITLNVVNDFRRKLSGITLCCLIISFKLSMSSCSSGENNTEDHYEHMKSPSYTTINEDSLMKRHSEVNDPLLYENIDEGINGMVELLRSIQKSIKCNGRRKFLDYSRKHIVEDYNKLLNNKNKQYDTDVGSKMLFNHDNLHETEKKRKLRYLNKNRLPNEPLFFTPEGILVNKDSSRNNFFETKVTENNLGYSNTYSIMSYTVPRKMFSRNVANRQQRYVSTQQHHLLNESVDYVKEPYDNSFHENEQPTENLYRELKLNDVDSKQTKTEIYSSAYNRFNDKLFMKLINDNNTEAQSSKQFHSLSKLNYNGAKDVASINIMNDTEIKLNSGSNIGYFNTEFVTELGNYNISLNFATQKFTPNVYKLQDKILIANEPMLQSNIQDTFTNNTLNEALVSTMNKFNNLLLKATEVKNNLTNALDKTTGAAVSKEPNSGIFMSFNKKKTLTDLAKSSKTLNNIAVNLTVADEVKVQGTFNFNYDSNNSNNNRNNDNNTNNDNDKDIDCNCPGNGNPGNCPSSGSNGAGVGTNNGPNNGTPNGTNNGASNGNSGGQYRTFSSIENGNNCSTSDAPARCDDPCPYTCPYTCLTPINLVESFNQSTRNMDTISVMDSYPNLKKDIHDVTDEPNLMNSKHFHSTEQEVALRASTIATLVNTIIQKQKLKKQNSGKYNIKSSSFNKKLDQLRIFELEKVKGKTTKIIPYKVSKIPFQLTFNLTHRPTLKKFKETLSTQKASISEAKQTTKKIKYSKKPLDRHAMTYENDDDELYKTDSTSISSLETVVVV